MSMVKERLNKLCDKLRGYSVQSVAEVSNLEIVETGYKTGHIPPKHNWKPIGVIRGEHCFGKGIDLTEQSDR